MSNCKSDLTSIIETRLLLSNHCLRNNTPHDWNVNPSRLSKSMKYILLYFNTNCRNFIEWYLDNYPKSAWQSFWDPLGRIGNFNLFLKDWYHAKIFSHLLALTKKLLALHLRWLISPQTKGSKSTAANSRGNNWLVLIILSLKSVTWGVIKTHCGLVTPYGVRELGQHWLR